MTTINPIAARSVHIPQSRSAQVIPFPSKAAVSPLAESINGKKSPPKITVEDIPPGSLLGLASIFDRKPDGLMELFKAKVQMMVGGLRIEGMPIIPYTMKSEIIDAVMDDPAMAGCSSLSEFIVMKARAVHAKWSEPIPKALQSQSCADKEDGRASIQYAALEIFETGRSGLKGFL